MDKYYYMLFPSGWLPARNVACKDTKKISNMQIVRVDLGRNQDEK